MNSITFEESELFLNKLYDQTDFISNKLNLALEDYNQLLKLVTIYGSNNNKDSSNKRFDTAIFNSTIPRIYERLGITENQITVEDFSLEGFGMDSIKEKLKNIWKAICNFVKKWVEFFLDKFEEFVHNNTGNKKWAGDVLKTIPEYKIHGSFNKNPTNKEIFNERLYKALCIDNKPIDYKSVSDLINNHLEVTTGFNKSGDDFVKAFQSQSNKFLNISDSKENINVIKKILVTVFGDSLKNISTKSKTETVRLPFPSNKVSYTNLIGDRSISVFISNTDRYSIEIDTKGLERKENKLNKTPTLDVLYITDFLKDILKVCEATEKSYEIAKDKKTITKQMETLAGRSLDNIGKDPIKDKELQFLVMEYQKLTNDVLRTFSKLVTIMPAYNNILCIKVFKYIELSLNEYGITAIKS